MGESPDDFEKFKFTGWIFERYLSSVSTDCVTYEAEVLGLLAAVEKLYLSKGPVPVQHVAIFEFTILSVWVNPTGRI